MFEGKCDWERPYWRCSTAPCQWLNLEECVWGQRDSYPALGKEGCFLCPCDWRLRDSAAVSSLLYLLHGFHRMGILQLSELQLPTVSGELRRQADKRGNAPLTWASVCPVHGFCSQIASQLHRAQLTQSTALLTSTPLPSVCLKMLHASHRCLPNAHHLNEMLSTSSDMKQTDPAQSLPNCHFGWCHVFICHQLDMVKKKKRIFPYHFFKSCVALLLYFEEWEEQTSLPWGNT